MAQSGVNYQEGLFYERVFGPERVEVRVDPKDPKGKRRIITLIDALGESLTVRDRHAQRRLYIYLGQPLGLKFGEISAKQPPEIQEQRLNQSLQKKPRELKFLFDEHGDCVGVSSRLHKQISWAQISEAVEKAVIDVFGYVKKSYQRENVASFEMPVDSKYVSLHANVDAGNNLIKGRSAIRISTRIRTEYDTASGGSRPACHNWANVWTAQLMEWFNVPLRSLEAEIPQEELAAIIPASSFEIHIDSTDISPKVFVDAFKKLKKVAETTITERVEASLQATLDIEEMREILVAYAVMKNLPKYAIDLVLESVHEETVWGLSQAISWVRTHAELKGKLDREERRIVHVLENIAGEMISLTPTIREFHDKVGLITFERLLGKKKPAKWLEEEPEITISGGAIVQE